MHHAMFDQIRSVAGVGIYGRGSWALGGSIGGIVGSLIFGVVLWLADPTIVTETIPAMYGFEPSAVGWGFHVFHGLVLGLVFGFAVSREPLLGTLSADVATDVIDQMGLGIRFALAGMVYGLAVWAVLPFIAATIWLTLGGTTPVEFPSLAAESLLGHLIYGLLLGALFSLFVDVEKETSDQDAPFEEP